MDEHGDLCNELHESLVLTAIDVVAREHTIVDDFQVRLHLVLVDHTMVDGVIPQKFRQLVELNHLVLEVLVGTLLSLRSCILVEEELQ